jgi:hypothetical protein
MSQGALSFLSNPAFWVLTIAGLFFSVVKYFQWQTTLAAASGGSNDVPIGKGLLGLVATAIGVFISYMVVQRQFDLSGPNIAGAVIATVFACLGSFLLLKDKSDFGFLDFLSFMKDGFLWSSTYPALAAAFHQIKFPITG